MYDYMKECSMFSIKDPQYGECTTSIMLPDGNLHIYGVSRNDLPQTNGDAIVVILKSGEHYRLVACQSKPSGPPCFVTLTCSKLVLVQNTKPVYNFVGDNFFMFDKIIFDLRNMAQICHFPHSAPDVILHTDCAMSGSHFATYNFESNSIKIFKICHESSPKMYTDFQLQLVMLTQTNSRLSASSAWPEKLIANPAVTWKCPRSHYICQIGNLDRNAKFSLFGIDPKDNEQYFIEGFRVLDADWEGWPTELDSEDEHFDILVQPTFLPSINRVFFIIHFWRVRTICIYVLDCVEDDAEHIYSLGEWNARLYVTPIKDCDKLINFFSGEHGILLLHLLNGGGEYVHMLYLDSWRLPDEELDPFVNSGKMLATRLPSPITKMQWVSRRRIIPFLGPFSEKFYDTTNREALAPFGFHDHPYFKNKNRKPYWVSTYLICSAQDDGTNRLYLLVCSLRVKFGATDNDTDAEELIKYEYWEFHKDRFISSTEQANNWQMQHIEILETFKCGIVPKEILVAKKHIIPGETMWKFQIMETTLIE